MARASETYSCYSSRKTPTLPDSQTGQGRSCHALSPFEGRECVTGATLDRLRIRLTPISMQLILILSVVLLALSLITAFSETVVLFGK